MSFKYEMYINDLSNQADSNQTEVWSVQARFGFLSRQISQDAARAYQSFSFESAIKC